MSRFIVSRTWEPKNELGEGRKAYYNYIIPLDRDEWVVDLERAKRFDTKGEAEELIKHLSPDGDGMTGEGQDHYWKSTAFMIEEGSNG